MFPPTTAKETRRRRVPREEDVLREADRAVIFRLEYDPATSE